MKQIFNDDTKKKNKKKTAINSFPFQTFSCAQWPWQLAQGASNWPNCQTIYNLQIPTCPGSSYTWPYAGILHKNIVNKIYYLGPWCGVVGQVVSVLTIYSDNTRLNPAEVYNISVKLLFKINKKAGVGPFKIYHQCSFCKAIARYSEHDSKPRRTDHMQFDVCQERIG